MIINKISENAKIICQIIKEKQEIQAAELIRLSRLKDSDFYIAIGWLAREGSISFIVSEKQKVFVLSN
jgi:hypothetical protein